MQRRLVPIAAATLGCFCFCGMTVHATERIVVAGGGLTETVFALGCGESVVGVDSSSVFPEVATKLPQVGYSRALSAEGVLSLRPTMVIASEDSGPDSTIAQLKQSGVPVHLISAQTSVPATIQRIEEVANLLGVSDRAKPVIDRLQSDLAKKDTSIDGNENSPKVLFIYARAGGVLNVAGRETGADTMIQLAGAKNAVTEFTGYKPLTAESAVAAAPDILLMTTRGIADAGGADAVFSHPGLALTPAAINRRVVTMDDLYLLGFGPRLGSAVQELREKLHDGDRSEIAAQR